MRNKVKHGDDCTTPAEAVARILSLAAEFRKASKDATNSHLCFSDFEWKLLIYIAHGGALNNVPAGMHSNHEQGPRAHPQVGTCVKGEDFADMVAVTGLPNIGLQACTPTHTQGPTAHGLLTWLACTLQGHVKGWMSWILISNVAATSGSPTLPLLEKVRVISFESFKQSLLGFTPFDACKWAGILSVAIAATKWVVALLFNPFFWMYFSWTWMFWLSLGALSIGIYGLYCLRKHYIGQANIFEQLATVTSTITWLTLVPLGFFNGFLEGWPLVFFLVYHYFFFLSATVRKRQYGDYYTRQHDPKWDVRLPAWYRLLFCGAVMGGHWLAAFEAPELHLIPGGWRINTGIWVLIMFVIFTHYYATVFLAKYVDNTAESTVVVRFGPYRSIRHPIYASTMLLFKAKLEENLMLETFGDGYKEYMNKHSVKKKAKGEQRQYGQYRLGERRKTNTFWIKAILCKFVYGKDQDRVPRRSFSGNREEASASGNQTLDGSPLAFKVYPGTHVREYEGSCGMKLWSVEEAEDGWIASWICYFLANLWIHINILLVFFYRDATDYDRDATDYDRDDTDYDRDATDYDLDATDYDRDDTDYDRDATDYDRDATDYDCDATDYDRDATDYKHPVCYT
ncbi:unnamed protein product [Rhodiola kirilowii]